MCGCRTTASPGWTFDRTADVPHPAGGLVPERVRELDVDLVGPLALGDVQVGAAQTGGADFSQYVQGPDTVGSARSSIVGRC